MRDIDPQKGNENQGKLMKLFFQKALSLLPALIILLHSAFLSAQVTDPVLRSEMRKENYYPGGKYFLFDTSRGSVKEGHFAPLFFPKQTLSGALLPMTHEREGFSATLGYETRFSGHGYEEHSPFDELRSGNRTFEAASVYDGFTIYRISYSAEKKHLADGYDGPQGGGYPEPTGAKDIYAYAIEGTATKPNTFSRDSLWERFSKDNYNAIANYEERLKEARKLARENDPNLNVLGNGAQLVRGVLQAGGYLFVMGYEGAGIVTSLNALAEGVTKAIVEDKTGKAVRALQWSEFAVKDYKDSLGEWAVQNPNAAEALQAVGAIAAITPRGKSFEKIIPDSVKLLGRQPIEPTKKLPSPYVKPDTAVPPIGIIYVDKKGNAIPTPAGGSLTRSKDNVYIQVRDEDGAMTGVRIDGAHKSHSDPRAQQRHAHVPGVGNDDGTPWLPLK